MFVPCIIWSYIITFSSLSLCNLVLLNQSTCTIDNIYTSHLNVHKYQNVYFISVLMKIGSFVTYLGAPVLEFSIGFAELSLSIRMAFLYFFIALSQLIHVIVHVAKLRLQFGACLNLINIRMKSAHLYPIKFYFC